MKFTNALKKVVATAATVASLVTGGLLASAAPASAVSGGQFQVCAWGNYHSYVEFPWRNWSTFIVRPGTCSNLVNIGWSNNLEPIHIWGYSSQRGSVWIQWAQVRPNKGGFVATYGSLDGNHWALIPAT